jgi:hypothetical protein
MSDHPTDFQGDVRAAIIDAVAAKIPGARHRHADDEAGLRGVRPQPGKPHQLDSHPLLMELDACPLPTASVVLGHDACGHDHS